VVALGFLTHLIHDRQSSRSGADDEPFALPRDDFLRRYRRVAERVPEFLGGFLLPLANLPTIDQHVVFVGNAIDTDAAEREIFETARGRRRRATSFHGIGPFVAVIT